MYSTYYEGWCPSVFYSEDEQGRYEHWTLQEDNLTLGDCAVMVCAILCQFSDWGHGVLAGEMSDWTYTLDLESAPAAPTVRRLEQQQ